jgi:hypothetical protein
MKERNDTSIVLDAIFKPFKSLLLLATHFDTENGASTFSGFLSTLLTLKCPNIPPPPKKNLLTQNHRE